MTRAVRQLDAIRLLPSGTSSASRLRADGKTELTRIARVRKMWCLLNQLGRLTLAATLFVWGGFYL
eukprot:6719907-Prymnesium_polylepis.1